RARQKVERAPRLLVFTLDEFVDHAFVAATVAAEILAKVDYETFGLEAIDILQDALKERNESFVRVVVRPDDLNIVGGEFRQRHGLVVFARLQGHGPVWVGRLEAIRARVGEGCRPVGAAPDERAVELARAGPLEGRIALIRG